MKHLIRFDWEEDCNQEDGREITQENKQNKDKEGDDDEFVCPNGFPPVQCEHEH